MAYDLDSLPPFYYILQRKGMFDIEPLGKGGFFVINYRFRVTPTEAAKKLIVREAKEPLAQGGSGEYLYTTDFKSCELDFIKVVSI